MRNGLRALLLLGLALLGSPGVFAAEVCVAAPLSSDPVCAYEFNPRAPQTVVLIHGLHGDPLWDWEKQLPFLSQHYHVLSLKLSGFYRAKEDSPLDGPAALAAALRVLTERYARGPVILMAHSMGGVIGLRYAIDYPEAVSRLVLVDVAGLLQRIAFSRALLSNSESSQADGDVFSRLAEKLVTKLLIELDDYHAEIAAQYQPRGEEDSYLPERPELLAAFQLIDADFSRSIDTLKPPALIVWGEKDTVAPLRTAYTLAARVPHSQLLIIPDAGHMVMREKPEVFNRALDDFLHTQPVLTRTHPSYPKQEGAVVQEEECRSENGRVYSGSYRRLALYGCDDALIHDARIGELLVNGSRLKVLNSDIGGGGFGLQATGSEVTVTASRIEGDIAIIASRSRLDLAAVEVTGHELAVQGKRGSDLIFSLSTRKSPLGEGPIHGYFSVDENHPL